MDRSHQFIHYQPAKPPTSEASKLSAFIVSQLVRQPLSVTRLRKMDRIELMYMPPNGATPRPIRFRFVDVVEHVQRDRTFKGEPFGLPPLESDWFDPLIEIGKPDGPIPLIDPARPGVPLEYAKFALALPFGDKFPLSPCIDREGAAYSTFQGAIQGNIVRLHQKLVAESYRCTSLDGVWLSDFRMLMNDCVSLVDITLHQLYFMAQYRGNEKGWRFEPEQLGLRHGRRLKDKLAWVGKITGRPLDNAATEVAALDKLKHVRNHLNHFDPPCFAYHVEDVVAWLNLVPDIGRLLWKIREKLDTQLSRGIVEIVTLPLASFVALVPELPRLPQPEDAGYRSTLWPDAGV